MAYTLKFSFSKNFQNPPSKLFGGIYWCLNFVKDDSCHWNIYLGAVPGPLIKCKDETNFVVELTAGRLRDNIKRSIISEKQSIKMKYNNEVYLFSESISDKDFYYVDLVVTIDIHCIRKYEDCSIQCDPIESMTKYHSIPEEQEVQIKNGAEYVKFPNCEFGDPSFKHSDLVVEIGDFQLFCHSQILSMNSPFFSDMIDQYMRKKKKKKGKYVLELSDIDNLVDFQNFLYLIYNPRVIPNAQNVENILIYADRFQVDVVKEGYEDFLLNGTHSLPDETLVAIAWRFNLKKLKESLDSKMKFMKFKDVFNSVHYQECSDDNKIEMCEYTILRFSSS